MLYFFYNTPFSIGTQLDPQDTFVGTGVQTNFVLQNKSIGELGSTITANNVQYAQYSSGFTKDAGTNSFTLATAPPLGANIVAPGISALTAAAFDNEVEGETNPRIAEVPFWYGDPYNINQFEYFGFPSDPGIEISLANLTSGYGAESSWCALACASPSGGALTYGATGASLWVAPLFAIGSLAASANAGASSILVGAASSGFISGDYICINPGGSNFEICHVSDMNASIWRLYLDSGGPNFNHAPGELVFTALRKGWVRVEIPLNQTNNSAANYYNLGFRRKGRIIARP